MKYAVSNTYMMSLHMLTKLRKLFFLFKCDTKKKHYVHKNYLQLMHVKPRNLIVFFFSKKNIYILQYENEHKKFC